MERKPGAARRPVLIPAPAIRRGHRVTSVTARQYSPHMEDRFPRHLVRCLVGMMQVCGGMLSNVPLFSGVPVELLGKLERYLELVTYDRDDVVFREGDPGDALYIVQSGEVAVLLVSSDGRELELAKLSGGNVFGELALLDGAPRSAEVRSTTRTCLLRLLRMDFKRALRSDPRIAEALLRIVAGRLRRDTQLAGETAFLDVAGRLARALLRLSDHDPESPRLTPVLSQAELARMIGSTRESVNRCLARYEQLQVLRRDGSRIEILDSEHLRRRAA